MNFPNFTGAKYITLDLETYDPHIKKSAGWATKDGHIAGYAVGADQLPAAYYPVGHDGGGNLDRDRVRDWIQCAVLDSGVPIVGHNVAYDLGWLLAENHVVSHSTRFVCTQIGAALLDEDCPSYSLDNLGRAWLGESKAEEGIREFAAAHGLDPKADLWRMPPDIVGRYASQDCVLTGRLWEYEMSRLRAESSEQIMGLEFALIPLFVAMRRRGVRIDTDALDRAESELRTRELDLLRNIEADYGVKVNVWAARSIAALCDKAGIPYSRTMTGMPSFTAVSMRASGHPALDMVLRARKVSKARRTFITSYKEHQVNGRIHSQINQLRSDDGGTITGRLSYSDPNLQQVPHRDPDLAPIIRRLFLPEPGASWISSDYSQQEPKLAVHYAHRLKLAGAGEVVSRMRADPRLDFHQMVADITSLPRGVAKNINLAIIYGMGPRKFAKTYGISEVEAKAHIQQHRTLLPFMRELASICSNRAEERGLIKTVLGRPCRFNLWEPVDKRLQFPLREEDARRSWPGAALKRAFGFTALNRLIQGSAADQIKRAMLMMWQEGIMPSLQIHDELCSSGDTHTAKRIEEIMTEAIKLEVPTIVDTAIGPNWAEAE